MTLAAPDFRSVYRDVIFVACGFDLHLLQQTKTGFADARAQNEIRTGVGEQNIRYRTGLTQRGLPRFRIRIRLDEATLLRVSAAIMIGVIIATFFAVRGFHSPSFPFAEG